MSLNRKEVNALNVLGMRKLNFIPAHFEKICLTYKIDTKLNSRYSIKTSIMLDENKKIIYGTLIGLEDQKELSLLTLGCTQLHKKGN